MQTEKDETCNLLETIERRTCDKFILERCQYSNGRILIMDDDKVVQLVVKKILNKIGYNVDCAESGLEAIEMYKTAFQQNESYTLVLMDLTIHGGMGGVEAVKLIKCFDDTVKVVVFSGYSNDPVVREYKKYGFDGVLIKPFSYSDFILLMKTVVNV